MKQGILVTTQTYTDIKGFGKTYFNFLLRKQYGAICTMFQILGFMKATTSAGVVEAVNDNAFEYSGFYLVDNKNKQEVTLYKAVYR